MRLESKATDAAILHELGARVSGVRLERNLTQAELAEKAGLSKRTIERLEAGDSVQLLSLIRLFRALDLLPRLEALIPEPVPSPIAQWRLRGTNRQRASAKKPQSGPSRKWEWRDDA